MMMENRGNKNKLRNQYRTLYHTSKSVTSPSLESLHYFLQHLKIQKNLEIETS